MCIHVRVCCFQYLKNSREKKDLKLAPVFPNQKADLEELKFAAQIADRS